MLPFLIDYSGLQLSLNKKVIDNDLLVCYDIGITIIQ